MLRGLVENELPNNPFTNRLCICNLGNFKSKERKMIFSIIALAVGFIFVTWVILKARKEAEELGINKKE